MTHPITEKIDLSLLQEGCVLAQERLRVQLSSQGYAILSLQNESICNVLQGVLDEAERMQTFRFPPHDGEIQYTSLRRQAFRVMFDICRSCLEAVMVPLDVRDEEILLLQHSLKESRSQDVFGQNRLHEPFQSGMSFSGSFFNIFDYDHGFLNAHRDRYLVTAITVRQFRDGIERSSLWVNTPNTDWVNVDAQLESSDIVILLGEELANLSGRLGHPMPAAEHCIRVSPRSDWLPRSHFRPDPASARTGNRKSVAFILGENRDVG